MSESLSNLSITRQDGACIVEFKDRKILEEVAIARLGEQLNDLVTAEPNPRLLLDFKNVEHLSSAALGMLITLKRQVEERKGRLVLTNIHPQIFEVFKITRLNKHFNIQNSTQDGLDALG